MNKLIVFDCGLRLVVSENPVVRSVALGVFVGAGAVTEPPEQSGISHLIEHMVFKGTEKRTAFDIVNETDSIGAQINAFTSKSSTCFYTVSQDIHAEKCAEVLADMYFNPKFAPDDLDKERKVVLEELSESEDTPDDICMEKLSSAFYKGHPLEKSILGTRKTLRALSSEDLHAYKRAHYVPSNTVISVAGNITAERAAELVKKYFVRGTEEAARSPRTPLEKAPMDGHFAHKKKEIEQAHIAFGFPGVAYDTPDSLTARVLASVFGTEMSSRLFQSVREKLGLCYSIVGYPSSYENNGCFIIYTATNPQNVAAAVKAIREEILLLVSEGITEEELRKGKEQIKTALVLGQESTSAMMRAFGRHALQTGKLYEIDEQIAEIDAITSADVMNLARKIFDFGRVSSSFVGAEIANIHKMIKGQE